MRTSLVTPLAAGLALALVAAAAPARAVTDLERLDALEQEVWTGGANWYLNHWLKLMLDFDRTTFDGGAPGGGNRPSEETLFTRLQLNC